MRKFTLKDFLSFYTPCLSCKNKVNITWSARKTALDFTASLGEFAPNFDGKHLSIDLKTTYYNKFSVMIDITSHSVISSDSAEFARYAAETECFVNLKCHKCNSYIASTQFKFDLNKRILKPFSIDSEMWHMIDDEHMYNIYTTMHNEESHIIVDKINATTPISPWQKKITAIPINRFMGKEDFLERIKTYMVFS